MPSVDCPACRQGMTSVTLERRPLGTLDVDFCIDCQALWFDTYESSQLAPGSVLKLFGAIATVKPTQRRALPASLSCPRCTSVLQLTQDLQHATRFSYYRCLRGHGRYTPFVQFLREKDFIRPLAPAELEKLKLSIKTIRCSSCGAPVDLATATACPYCRAPIAALDQDAIERAIRSLSAAQQQQSAPQPDLLGENVLAMARVESAMKAQRTEERYGVVVDIVALGINAVAALLFRG